jgi:uncharacterized protein (TIGR02246 family)
MKQCAAAVPFIACVLLLSACGGGPAAPEFGRADGEAIRKQIADYAATWNRKDIPTLLGFFAGNAVLMPPNASTVRGHDSIQGYFEARFAAGGADLVLEPQDVSGYGTLAYTSGTYSSRTVPPDGAQATRDRGKFLWIMRKLNGQWRHEYQIWSSDLPEPVATQ